jgi:iron-sulfur cluster repair protein YtfE (RIC family)
MSTIQVQATLSRRELLKATQQLDIAELKEFMAQLSTVYAQRKTPHLSQKETELLQKINQGISLSVWQPYKNLVARRNEGSLTDAEYEELIHLSDQIERLHAERIGYLVELAQMRNIPLPQLMDELGIQPLNHA